MRTFLIGLVLIYVMAACLDEPPCAESSTNPVFFSFRAVADGADSTVLVDSIYLRDPALTLYRDVSIPEGIIPLYPDQEQVYFVIRAGGRADSLLLSYTRTAVLYATNCGVEFEYRDMELVSSTFDSLRLFLEEKPPAIEIFY